MTFTCGHCKGRIDDPINKHVPQCRRDPFKSLREGLQELADEEPLEAQEWAVYLVITTVGKVEDFLQKADDALQEIGAYDVEIWAVS